MKLISIITILFFYSTITAQSNRQLLELKKNIIPNSLEQNLPSTTFDLGNTTFEKKSKGLAVLYSLLLPGMGEFYADNYSTGQYFTIADAVAWSFVTGYSIYGNNQQDDYKAYAKTFGGVNVEDKEPEFFADISAYENIELFNTEKELNRQFDKTYDVQTHTWDWQNAAQRKEYRAMWTDSEGAFNNVRFAVGALIVNRIISAISAVRSVSAYNKREENNVSWNINFGTRLNPNLPSGLVLNFRKSF
ncbi:MAG: hypothetical protein V3V16_08855 [Melioribacteraceae bacterium]